MGHVNFYLPGHVADHLPSGGLPGIPGSALWLAFLCRNRFTLRTMSNILKKLVIFYGPAPSRIVIVLNADTVIGIHIGQPAS